MMFYFKYSSLLAVLSLLFSYTVNAAVVSLFIPDTDPAAITADILGTDAEGRTTWRLAPGQPSGTLRPPPTPVTATMVAGPKDVHVVEYVPDFGATFYDDCVITEGTAAICTVVLSSAGGVQTAGVHTESIGALEVQIATPPATAATGTMTGVSAPGTQTASGSAGTSASPGALQTGSSGNGAAGRVESRPSMLAVGAGAVVFAVSLFWC
ncbi:hypothetical protein C8Q80DRAFT_921129 [Daedaleopsis nitida]|nr:hypothetical protein C8Q80DRAFT_921129 [Daedaleopsis nitida]